MDAILVSLLLVQQVFLHSYINITSVFSGRVFIFGFKEYSFPGNIYLFKVNNRDSRKRCEICSKLTIKTPERRH